MEKKYILVEYTYDNDGIVQDYVPSPSIFMYNEDEAKKQVLDELLIRLNNIMMERANIFTAINMYDEYIGKDIVVDYNSLERKYIEMMYSQHSISGKDKYNKASFKSKHMVPKDKIEKCLTETDNKIKMLREIIRDVKANSLDITKVQILVYCATKICVRKVVELKVFEEE